jgi:hypothetical protein
VTGEIAIQSPCLPGDDRAQERRGALAGEPFGGRDCGLLASAVLASSAGPVGQNQDLAGDAKLFQWPERLGDRDAGGAL